MAITLLPVILIRFALIKQTVINVTAVVFFISRCVVGLKVGFVVYKRFYSCNLSCCFQEICISYYSPEMAITFDKHNLISHMNRTIVLLRKLNKISTKNIKKIISYYYTEMAITFDKNNLSHI
jgi:hypothetical protein